MISEMTELSIIIVSWNTRELLRECLESLFEFAPEAVFETFVVDNASSDQSVAMVQETFPNVKVIANGSNVGFSRANNQAIQKSKGRYIALLNPDTVLIEDVFTPLLRYADANNEMGAIGPKILCRDGKTIQNVCARRLPNLYFDFCRLSGLSRMYSGTRIFGGEYLSHWDHNSHRNVESLAGACMVVRRKTIDQVGMMDEKQFMYGDEIDWCKRILDSGWIIRYYPDAKIIHYGGESAKQAKLTASIESEKAQMYFYRKHKGRFYAFLFSVQVLVFNLGKYVWSMCFRKKDERGKELMDIYKGLYSWSLKQMVSRDGRALS
jgi:GT2 family glycosyltransferase